MDQPENDQQQLSGAIGKIVKTGGATFGTLNLFKTALGIVVFGAILVYFMFHGLPIYIGAIFILILVAIFILQIWQLKRIVAVNLDFKAGSPSLMQKKIDLTPDEKIVAAVAGIMQSFSTDASIIRSTEVLGVGEILHPENALVITNKHILFLYIPLVGANKNVAGVDIGMADWLLAKKDIESKLNEMLSSMSLGEVYASYPKNFGVSLNNLAKAEFSNLRQNIKLITKDNKDYSYAIRAKEDYEKLKQIFANYG